MSDFLTSDQWEVLNRLLDIDNPERGKLTTHADREAAKEILKLKQHLGPLGMVEVGIVVGRCLAAVPVSQPSDALSLIASAIGETPSIGEAVECRAPLDFSHGGKVEVGSELQRIPMITKVEIVEQALQRVGTLPVEMGELKVTIDEIADAPLIGNMYRVDESKND